MKTRRPEYLPLRDVPLALVYSALWFVGLWVVEYPAYESVGVIILAYITLWVSRLVVYHSLDFLARRLHRATLLTADRLGVEIPDEQTILANMGARLVLVALALLIAAVATILGASFILLVGAVSLTGLQPLGVGFSIAGLLLLCAGLGVVIVFYTRSYARLSKLQDMSDGAASGKIGERVGYIRHSERLTQWLSV